MAVRLTKDEPRWIHYDWHLDHKSGKYVVDRVVHTTVAVVADPMAWVEKHGTDAVYR